MRQPDVQPAYNLHALRCKLAYAEAFEHDILSTGGRVVAKVSRPHNVVLAVLHDGVQIRPVMPAIAVPVGCKGVLIARQLRWTSELVKPKRKWTKQALGLLRKRKNHSLV